MTADWDAIPATADIYFTREYHEVSAIGESGEPQCFAASHGEHTLVVSGLARPAAPQLIAGALDLQSCNGYGGPLLNSTAAPSEDALEAMWASIGERAAKKGIAAAFFRLHPLVRNERWLPRAAEIRLDRKTVFIDTRTSAESAWQQASARHRNMVRKAGRAGAQIRWNAPEDWEAFFELYDRAMVRLEAPSALRFTKPYFSALALASFAELAAIRRDDRLHAAAILLRGPQWAHYHLASRAADADNSLASALVDACVARTRDHGLDGLHLGGGRTPDPGDSLLKFKTSLGGEPLDYRVARVIFDPERFEQLRAASEERSGRKSTWLLPYREGPR